MKFNPYVGTMVAVGACLLSQPVLSCSIIMAFIPVPIDCLGENTPFSDEKFPDWGLQMESIETASHHSSIASNAENFSKKLGRVGGGSLKASSGDKINKIAREMRLSARDGAQAITGTLASVDGVSGTYSSCKSSMEDKYAVLANQGVGYSTSAKEGISENQRVALDSLATYGLSMASATSADVNAANGVSTKEDDDSVLTPKKRAEEMAKADTVQGMYEMITILDRAVYERSLKAASVEATAAGIQAMKVIAGVSSTADNETE